MTGQPEELRCTFRTAWGACGLTADAPVHVREDEPMRRKAHVWRHESRARRETAGLDVELLAEAMWVRDQRDPNVEGGERPAGYKVRASEVAAEYDRLAAVREAPERDDEAEREFLRPIR